MLLWLILAALVILPVALRLYASDDPRNDEPPDTDEDRPGPAPLPIVA